MKKHLLALLLLLAAAPAVRAQDWLESLKKVATAAADKAADGKLTQYAIVGTWEYARPGVRFESDDLTSELGAAAVQGSVQEKLVRAYELAGIRPGACTFAFGRDGRLPQRQRPPARIPRDETRGDDRGFRLESPGTRKSRRAARTLPRRLPRVRVRPQLTAGYVGTSEPASGPAGRSAPAPDTGTAYGSAD